jgi:DNA-binding transcriptional ArsR family regulator
MGTQIQRALRHPRRTEILLYLMQREGSEGTDEDELADSLGLKAARVRYHLTVLRDADLISRADERGPSTSERYLAAHLAGR